MQEVFDVTDYHLGLCTKEQIGLPKSSAQSPSPDAPSPLADAPEQSLPTTEEDEVSLRTLRQKALSLALADPDFFANNPDFHKRFLLAMAKMPETQPTQPVIRIEIPWLQSGRLSYRNPPPEVQDVEPKALEAQPWKESPSPSDVSLGIDALKKSMKPLGS